MTDTTTRPLVTFAVIAYNQEAFIRAAIEGAFAQTYAPLEIILSDDLSPDRTFAIMQEMAAAYDGPHRVVLNRNDPNRGVVQHVDRVMELARGDFVVVNAGDDVSLPGRTARLVAAWLGSGRQAKLIHSAARRVDADGRPLDIRRPPEWMRASPTPAEIIARQGYVIGATAAWDRDLYARFGPLGPGVSTEDVLLPFRAALDGHVAYLDEALVDWRDGGVSTGVDRMTGWQYLYGRAHKARKWWAEIYRHIPARFGDRSYPGKADIEALCRAREPDLQFRVDLAEARHGRRLRMLPRAVRLALKRRSLSPVTQWASYLFDAAYMPYATWAMARRARTGRTVPAPRHARDLR